MPRVPKEPKEDADIGNARKLHNTKASNH